MSESKLNLRIVFGLSGALIVGLAMTEVGQAAENATGFYLLGSKTTMAGYLPAPGFYFADQNYFYSGKTSVVPVDGGQLQGNVDATAIISIPTALWVTDGDVFGGNLAFTLSQPLVYKSIGADAFLGSKVLGSINESNFAMGDPVLGSTLGWHSGNLHYSLNALVNVPIGQWEKGQPDSAGFHHWAIDTTGAVTWLDPKSGFELSAASGLTFNFQNPDTNYTTGTEFHLEGATMLHLSHTFSFGLNGYYYQQLTGDSGSGAVLGDFKGRVIGIGPAVDFTMKIGQTPVLTSLRYFHEFDVENRMAGDAAFLNVAIPLSVASTH
jgi:hypothetical protein